MWKRRGSGKPQQTPAAMEGSSLAERPERQAAVDRSSCSRLTSRRSPVRAGHRPSARNRFRSETPGFLLLGAELEDRVALGDRGRVGRRTDVLLHPLRGAPRGLVGPGLIFTDRHGHPAIAAANCRVVDEAWNPANEGLYVLLPLAKEIEEFRCALPRIGPNDCVHGGLPFTVASCHFDGLRLNLPDHAKAAASGRKTRPTRFADFATAFACN